MKGAILLVFLLFYFEIGNAYFEYATFYTTKFQRGYGGSNLIQNMTLPSPAIGGCVDAGSLTYAMTPGKVYAISFAGVATEIWAPTQNLSDCVSNGAEVYFLYSVSTTNNVAKFSKAFNNITKEVLVDGPLRNRTDSSLRRSIADILYIATNAPNIHLYNQSGYYIQSFSLSGVTAPITSIAFSYVLPYMYVANNSTLVRVYNAYTFAGVANFTALDLVSGIGPTPTNGLLLTGPTMLAARYQETFGWPYYSTISGLSSNATSIKIRLSYCTISCPGGYCMDNYCYCNFGWTNLTNNCKTDIDECASSACGSYSTCTNGNGYYACTCAKGTIKSKTLIPTCTTCPSGYYSNATDQLECKQCSYGSVSNGKQLAVVRSFSPTITNGMLGTCNTTPMLGYNSVTLISWIDSKVSAAQDIMLPKLEVTFTITQTVSEAGFRTLRLNDNVTQSYYVASAPVCNINGVFNVTVSFLNVIYKASNYLKFTTPSDASSVVDYVSSISKINVYDYVDVPTPSCTPCVGNYSIPNAGNSSCVCKSGSYKDNNNICVACNKGYYSLAGDTCKPCDDGTASNITGRTTICDACPVGTEAHSLFTWNQPIEIYPSYLQLVGFTTVNSTACPGTILTSSQNYGIVWIDTSVNVVAITIRLSMGVHDGTYDFYFNDILVDSQELSRPRTACDFIDLEFNIYTDSYPYYTDGSLNKFFVVGSIGDFVVVTNKTVAQVLVYTITNPIGASTCTACDYGYFSNTTGTAYCSSCDEGVSTLAKGSSSCDVACGSGTFSPNQDITYTKTLALYMQDLLAVDYSTESPVSLAITQGDCAATSHVITAVNEDSYWGFLWAVPALKQLQNSNDIEIIEASLKFLFDDICFGGEAPVIQVSDFVDFSDISSSGYWYYRLDQVAKTDQCRCSTPGTELSLPISVWMENNPAVFITLPPEDLGTITLDYLSSYNDNRVAAIDIKFVYTNTTKICRQCPTGMFSNTTKSGSCELCPPGTAASVPGKTECTKCALNTYSSGYGAVKCTQCPVGTQTDSTGSTSCVGCPAGSYYSTSNGTCVLCPIGTFNPKNSTTTYTVTSCAPCPTGQFAETPGSLACTKCGPGSSAQYSESNQCLPCPEGTYERNGQCVFCPLGTYNNITGQTDCFPCELGTYSDRTNQTQCFDCLEGTFANTTGLSSCWNCPAGSSNNETGRSECDPCAIGHFANDTGFINCLPCEFGTANPSLGQTSCIKCEKGTFSDEYGLTNCKPCQPGSHANSTGKESCDPCPPGYYQDQPNAQNCIACAKGKYMDSYGNSSCLVCPSSYITSLVAQTFCTSCDLGLTNNEDHTSCQNCPLNSYRNSTSDYGCTSCPGHSVSINTTVPSTGIQNCGCAPGYYGSDPRSCNTCPEGGVCPGQNEIYSKPGYYQSPKQYDVFLQCSTEEACPGHNLCGVGYTGLLCGECDHGSPRFYRIGDQCKKCPDHAAWYMVLFAIVAVIIAAILLRVGGSAFRGAPIATIFNLVQISALFGGFNLRWPPALKTVFNILSSINLNVDLFSPECSASVSYYDRWIVTLFLPVILIVVVTLVFGVLLLLNRYGTFGHFNIEEYKHKDISVKRFDLTIKERLGNPKLIFNAYINAILLLSTVCYTFVNAKIFELFSCTNQADGTASLNASPVNLCYDKDWNSMVPIAVFAMILYTIGVPALIATIVFRNKDRILRRDIVFGDRFGAAFLIYKRKYFYWEILQCSRKLGIVLARILADPLFQCVVGIVVLFISLQLQIYFQPFDVVINNRLEYISILVPLIILYAGLLFYSQQLPEGLAKTLIIVFVIVLLCVAIVLIVAAVYNQVLTLLQNTFKKKRRYDFDQRTQFLRFLLPESWEIMKNSLIEMDDAEQLALLEEFQDLAKLMSHQSEDIINATEMVSIENGRPDRREATYRPRANKTIKEFSETDIEEPSFTRLDSKSTVSSTTG